jgi:hypothetical protein
MFKPGDPKPEKSGRKKGVQNKIKTDVRQFVLDQAEKFERTPGRRLADVDSEVFWSKIFPKIIPKDINVQAQIWTRSLSDDELDARIRVLMFEVEKNGVD